MHGALRTNGRTVRTVGIAKNKLSWLFVGALLALCGFLGALQYHWIGEVTVAARDRLRGTLRASLIRTSQDFNSETGDRLQPDSAVRHFAATRRRCSTRWRRSIWNGRRVRAMRRCSGGVGAGRAVGAYRCNCRCSTWRAGRFACPHGRRTGRAFSNTKSRPLPGWGWSATGRFRGAAGPGRHRFRFRRFRRAPARCRRSRSGGRRWLGPYST